MIWKFTKVLIIHLKRFTNDGEKINNFVDFSINSLDLKNIVLVMKKINQSLSLLVYVII